MADMKEISTPAASELAEYILLQSDIKAALSMMTLYFEKYAGKKDLPEQERYLVLSIYRDAITNFIGCFSPAKGTTGVYLDADVVYASAKNGLSYFKWLKDIRDSYAAHRFGPYRQCVVGIVPNAGNAVIGTGNLQMIYSGPVPDGKGDMLSFISVAAKYVDAKIRELGAVVLEEARQLTPEQIAALPVATVRPVDDPGNVRISRAAFQRGASRSTKPDSAD